MKLQQDWSLLWSAGLVGKSVWAYIMLLPQLGTATDCWVLCGSPLCELAWSTSVPSVQPHSIRVWHRHRTVEVERDLGPSGLSHSQAGPPRAGCPRSCPHGFGYLQGRLHYISGQTVSVLHVLYNPAVFSNVQTAPPVFSLCPLPLVLWLGITQQSLEPSLQVLVDTDQIPGLSILHIEPSQASAFSHHLHGPSLDSIQYVPVSHATKLRNGHSAPSVVSLVWIRFP